MVGIVTGNGLGLFNASQNLLGGFGSPQGGARVNVSTGNLVIQGLDRTQSGVGIDLTAVRTYNALGSVGGADGWFWNGERKVQLTGTLNSSGSSVIRTGADGHETVFSWNGSAYVSSEGEGAHDSLSWDSGNSQWVWTEGNSRASDRYDSTGRLVSLTDTSGNVQTFAYDGSGRLSSVTDSSGQAIVFVYDGSGRLERLDTRETTSGALTQRVYYGYDGSGRLSTVKTDLTPSDNSISDNVVYTTTYTYDSTSLRIASITQGDGTTVSFTYTLVGSDYRVASVTDAAGTTTFSYDTTNRVTTVTNGAGQAWEYSYDSSDRLLEVRTPAIGGQRQITTYTYDGDGNVSSVTDGLGRTVTYVYDSAGNLTLERDEAGNTVKRTYTATNQLQNEIRYTAVSTESGGVWTLPSDSTALVTRYVYDSNDRLRFTVSAEGRVSEYRYDACGQLTDEVGYTADLYSVGSLAPTDTLSLSSLTGWLPTTAAQTRSALHYDYRGNLDWRKDYAAVDGSGAGIADSGMTYTKYVYDQTGLLLQTIAVTGSGRTTETTQVSYGYDGAGRLQSEVSAAGTKTWAYDASARTTTVSQTINTVSRTTVQTFGSTGRLTSQVEAATGLTSRTTSYVYDDAGRLRMQEDAAGARSYLFYDAASRVVGRVDALGGVTETVYNEAGQITSEIRYATRVSTGSWLSGGVVTPTSLSAIRPSTHADDRTTAFGYDSVGRRTTITDAGGTVSTTTYDAAGRVLRVETGSSPVRTTRFFYDKDGKLIAQLDAEGYLVRHSYDAAGQLRQSLRYASITSSSLWASGTLSALEGSLANTTGLSSWFFYDAQGRQTGTVNEQQFVTATVYNDEARTQQTVRYLDAYTGTVTTSTAFSTITGALTGSDTVTTSTQFDTLGRVSTRTAADGTVTSYGYDAYNRLVQETAASGGSQARETHYRYDAYGQVVSKLWGEGATHLTGGMTESQIAAVHAQYGELYSYDVLGRRAQVTDRANHVTTYYYDDLGQLTHVINAAGGIVETSYSTFGQVSETRTYDNPFTDTGMTLGSLTGGLLGATLKSLVEGIRDATHDRRVQHTYNTRGLLTQRTDGEGWRTQYTYNAFGEVATQLREQSLNVFATDSTSYNLRGEVTGTVRDVGGLAVTTATAYDAFGRIVSRTNELGKTTTTAYTDAGRTVTETDPLSHTRSRTYDALGRVLTVTDSLGKVTTYAYDDVTRTTTVTTPEGVVTATALSEHGQTLSVTDGNGHTTTYAYNRNGDLLTTEDAASTVVVTNAYDAESGLLETVTDALGGVVTFTYDALNRVATRTQATGSITVYAFDTHGSQVTVTEADGTAQERTTVYGYDENGRVLTATVDPSGLALKTTYTYDGEGRQLTVAKGTTASPAQQVTTFTYDTLGRVTSQSENAAGISTDPQYALDPVTGELVVANGNTPGYAVGTTTSIMDAVGYTAGSETTVSSTGGTQNYSKIVQLSNGDTVVAWTLDDGTGWRAQRYNSSGVAQGSVITLNTVTGGGSSQRNLDMSLAALTGGGFVAVWTNQSSGGADAGNIYMRRFDNSGAVQTTGGSTDDVLVNTTTTNQTNGSSVYVQGKASVLGLADGTYVVAWQSPKSTTPYYDVRFQRFNASGVAQGSETRVDSESGSNSAESPRLHLLSNGNFLVSYRSSNNQGKECGRIYSAAGSSQGGSFDLENGGPTNGPLRVVALATGGFLAVRQEQSTSRELLAQEFNSSGNEVNSDISLLSLPDTQNLGIFFLTATGSGTYSLFYEVRSADLSSTELRVQRFDAFHRALGAANVLDSVSGSQSLSASATLLASGNVAMTWSEPGVGVLTRNLTVANSNASATIPGRIIKLSNGNYVVAWTRIDGSGWRAQLVGSNGGKIGSEFALNAESGGGAVTRNLDVSLTALSGGGFVAVWTNQSSGGADAGNIYMRRFDNNGAVQTTGGSTNDVLVNTTTANQGSGNSTLTQKNARVVALTGGGYVVVWQSPYTGSKFRIYFQRFDASGVAQGSETEISPTQANSYTDLQIVALSSGGFAVGYRDDEGNQDGFNLRTYSSTGVASGSAVELFSYDPDGTASMDILSGGDLVVSYRKNTNEQEIRTRRFTTAGVAVGSEVRFAIAAGFSGLSVAAATDNAYVLSWQGTDGTASVVRFDANHKQTSLPLVMAGAGSVAALPALLPLGNGNLATAWAGGTAGLCFRELTVQNSSLPVRAADSATTGGVASVRLANGDLVVAWPLDGEHGWRAQRYTSAGVPAGNEFFLNTDIATQNVLNRDVSLTALSTGGFVAVWSNNEDVYFRRFDASGNAVDAAGSLANTTTAEQQKNARVLALDSGAFAVTWQARVSLGVGQFAWRIKLQRFNADGTKAGSETAVDTTSGSTSAEDPQIVRLSNGNLMVSYRTIRPGNDIRQQAQIFSSSGVAQGSELTLNTGGLDAGQTRLVALSGGGFAVLWQPVAANDTLQIRRFDNTGTPVDSSWQPVLWPAGSRDLVSFSLTALSGGGYALAYQLKKSDLSGSELYVQRYDAQYRALGPAYPVDSVADASAFLAPVITDMGSGRMAIAWSGKNDVSDTAPRVFARVLETDDQSAQALDVRTQYKYDAAGRLTRTLDANGNSSWNVYDDAGRVQYAVNALGDVTEYVYDNNNRVTSTVRYATRVATGSYGDVVTPAQVTPTADSARDARTWTIYDEDGRATVQVDALRQATRLTYDDAGNVIESRRLLAPLSANTANWASELAANPAGISTHRAYDVLNRLRFEVDGKGQVSEWQYDDAGNVTAKLRYDDVLTGAASWSEAHIAAALTGETARKTLYLYNTAGQLTYEAVISGGVVAGAINGHVYDALGRVVGQRSFPAPVAGSAIAAGSVTLSALDAAWTATAAGDRRITHTILDQAGNARYTLNSLGYVLEQRFDALGRLTDTLQYRNDIDVGALSALDVATVGAAAEAANAAADTVVRTRIVRDVLGRERFVIDALGNVSEKIYDALGNVIEQRQYAPSSALSFGTYSESAVASAVSGLTGTQVQVTRFAYDQTGRLRFTLDALGYLSENRYDALGRTVEQVRYGTVASSAMVLSAVDLTEAQLAAEATLALNGRSTRYVYDANGALHYSLDALGYVTEQVRDAHGRVLRETRYSTAVNLSGNPTEAQVASAITGLAGRSTHYRYDAVGNAELTVDALGYGTRRVFDAFGNVTSETRHAAVLTGGAAVSDSESLTTVAGRLTSDTLNRTTTWEYNALGQLVTQTSPAAEFIVTISSAPVAVLGVLKTRFTYDGFGNLETRSEGEVVGNRVDNNAAVTDTAEVRTSAFEYDLLGRQTASIAPGWYDTTDGKFYKDDRNAGESVAQTDRFQVRTEVQYDGFGNAAVQRVNTTGASSWATTRRVYDVLNRLRFEIDALGYVTESTYDGYGNNTTATRYANAINSTTPTSGTFLTEAHMLESTRITESSTSDRTLTMVYDALNRKTSVAQPTVAVYVYGGDSTSSSGGLIRVAESLDGAGTLHYANVTGSTTTGTPVVNWTYNAFGEQVKEVIAGGPTTFHYFDALGRKTAMVDGLGYYTAFEYFADTDKVKKQTEYATAVSLSGVTENSVPSAPSANGNDRTLQYTYNNLLQLTKTERLNATWWAANAGQTSYTQNTGTLTVGTVGYNAFGEAVQNTDAAGNATTMDYDGLGRITQMTEPARRTARSGEGGIDPFWSVQNGGTTLYDNRLSASPVVMMAYDRFGQAVTQTRAAASGQAGLTQVTQTSYDHAGNVIALEDAAGGVKQFKVNAQGRTIEETQEVTQDYSEWSGLPSGAGTQTKRKTYAWDLLGRQTATTSHYMDGATAKETADIAEYNAYGEVSVKKINGTTLETYTYDKAGRVIQTVNANGTTHYHYDLAGRMTRSVGVGDGTNPDRVTVNVYDVLGRLTEQRLPKSLFNLSSSSDTATTLTDAIPLVKQQFDRWGNVTQRTDARGSAWKYTYNADNRNLTEESPQEMAITVTGATITMGQLKTARYDALGNVAMALDGKVETGTTTVALRSESFFYNTVGQLVKDIDATGIIREYAVDAHGNRVATKDGVGTVRYTDYDAMNRVIETGVLRTGLPGYGLAEPLKPAGSESQVAEAGSSPYINTVSTVVTGGYVVAWVDGQRIKGRLFDQSGQPSGSAFVISTVDASTSQLDIRVSLATLSTGGFVAVWQRGGDIYMRRFNADGSYVESAEVLVNTENTVDYSSNVQDMPSVATLADGSWVVVWQSPISTTSADVYLKRYSAGTGTSVNVIKSATKVNTTANSRNADVLALASGGYVISYSTASNILAQRYSASDTVSGSEFTMNTLGLSAVARPQLIMLSSGDFLAAWVRPNTSAIVVQAFTSTGTKVGSEVSIVQADWNSTLDGVFGLVALQDGGYAITYEVRNNSENRTFISRFDAAHYEVGARVELERLEGNPTPWLNYTRPSLLALDGDSLVALWGGSNLEGSYAPKIYARAFTAGNQAAYAAYGSEPSAVQVDGLTVTSGLTQVDSAAAGTNNHTRVIALANGGHLVAWTLNDGSGWYAQRYNADGTVNGSAFALNSVSGTGSSDRDLDVSIVELDDGNGTLVATWTNNNDIYARRFSASGTPLTTNGSTVEFIVNTTTTDYSSGAYIQKNPVVAALSGGGFVIAWQSPKSTTPDYKVFFQRYDSSGTAQGSETQVDQNVSGATAFDPQIVVMTSGEFVVAYHGYSSSLNMRQLNARRYSASGVLQGSTFTIEDLGLASYQWKIARLSTGGFVAVWQDGSTSLRVQRYTATGTNSGSETSVSLGLSGTLTSFGLTATNDGGYVVSYEFAPTGFSGKKLYMRRFNSSNAGVGGGMEVYSTAVSQGLLSSMATLASGAVVMGWDLDASSSEGSGIFTRKVLVETTDRTDFAHYYPTTGKFAIQSFLYDEAGQRYAEIRGDAAEYVDNRNGNVKYTRFDERGNVIQTRTESGVLKTYEYDEANLKKKEIDGNGKFLLWTYNAAAYNRLATHVDLAGRTTTYGYNVFGQLATESTDDGNDGAVDADTKVYNPSTISGLNVVFATGTDPDLDDPVLYDLPSFVTTHTYHANGMLQSVATDYGRKTKAGGGIYYDIHKTERAYDASGNIVLEKNTRTAEITTSGTWNDGLQEVRYRLDSMGRVENVVSDSSQMTMFYDPNVNYTTANLNYITFYYDEFGNYRRMLASAWVSSGNTKTADDWYKYDLADRMVLADAAWSGGVMVANSSGGTEITYDEAGRRKTEEAWSNYTPSVIKTGGSSFGEFDLYKKKYFHYDDLGNLALIEDSNNFRQLGQNTTAAPQTFNNEDNLRFYDADGVQRWMDNGWVGPKQINTFDAYGRLVAQSNFKLDESAKSNSRYSYQGDGQLVSQTDYLTSTANLGSRLLFDEKDMRDDAGNQLSYRYDAFKTSGQDLDYQQVYTTTFALFDGYKQIIETVSKNEITSGTGFGKTTFDYVGNGELVQAKSIGGNPFWRNYVSNRMGQMIARVHRISGDWKGQYYYYHDGKSLMNVGRVEPKVAFSLGFQSATSADLSNTPSSYVASVNDTAETVARAVYGDTSYAYLIADANGLASVDTAIADGTTVLIPNVLTNSYNAHDTVKPYNASDIIGDTTPVPKPPPPPKDKSGGFAQIVMIVVAVVATIFTAGAAGAAFGAAFATTTTAAGVTTLGAWAAGVAAMGSTSLAAIGAVALGSVVGSAVSQQVGDKWLGQGPVDWAAVGRAGVGSVLTAGFGVALGKIAQVAMKAPGVSWAVKAIDASEKAWGAVQGSVASTLSGYTTARLYGERPSFSWEAMAGNAIVSGITAGTLARYKLDTAGPASLETLRNKMTTAGIAAVTEDKWFGGSRPNYAQLANSVVAQFMGDVVREGISTGLAARSAAATGVATGAEAVAASAPQAASQRVESSLASGPFSSGIDGYLDQVFDDTLKGLGVDSLSSPGYILDAFSFEMMGPPRPSDRQVVVQKGDTLYGIAKRELGDGGLYALLGNSTLIHPGDTVNIPGIVTDAMKDGAHAEALAQERASARRVAAQEIFLAQQSGGASPMIRDGLTPARIGGVDAERYWSLSGEVGERALQQDIFTLGADTVNNPITYGLIRGDRSITNDLQLAAEGARNYAVKLRNADGATTLDRLLGSALWVGTEFSPQSGLGVAGAMLPLGMVGKAGKAFQPSELKAGKAFQPSELDVKTLGILEEALFAQKIAKGEKEFGGWAVNHYTKVAGRDIKTVNDLAQALREGVVSPSQLPINYVVMKGVPVIQNTRTSTALIFAGIPKSQWYGINKTGLKTPQGVTFDELVQRQLDSNYGGSLEKARR
ncbi:MAG: hypothetical protein ACOY3X_05325 [Pseudomonadota bacterium]